MNEDIEKVTNHGGSVLFTRGTRQDANSSQTAVIYYAGVSYVESAEHSSTALSGAFYKMKEDLDAKRARAGGDE